jgi:hypothetical protein
LLVIRACCRTCAAASSADADGAVDVVFYNRYCRAHMATIITIMPVWLIGVFLLALLALSSWAGSRLRQRLQFNSEAAYAASAAVSLLALLIGFTFSLALNRYDNRRELVVEEAAAIFAVWQRVPLLKDPARAELAKLARRYADQRYEYFTKGIDHDNALRADRTADYTVERMWTIVRGLTEAEATPLVTRMLLDNLTRIDDAAWRREAMAREHIPNFVVDLLVIFAVLTAASLGFAGQQHRRVHPAHLIFFMLVSASIWLIIDLDRPRSGLVLVSQRPLIEVSVIMATGTPRLSPGLRDAAANPLPVPKLTPDDAVLLPDEATSSENSQPVAPPIRQ